MCLQRNPCMGSWTKIGQLMETVNTSDWLLGMKLLRKLIDTRYIERLFCLTLHYFINFDPSLS